MTAEAITITLKVNVAWWVKHYLSAVFLFYFLMMREPDYDKVLAVVIKGIKVSQ